MKITLVSNPIRMYESQMRIPADVLINKVDGNRDEYDKWIDKIRDFVKDEKQHFSELREVINTLQNPEVKRDEDGLPVADGRGNAVPIPFKKVTLKKNSQILRVINEALDKLDSDLPMVEIPEISFDLSPDHVLHLADMILKKSDSQYTLAAPYILDFVEKFEDYDEKAKAAKKNKPKEEAK